MTRGVRMKVASHEPRRARTIGIVTFLLTLASPVAGGSDTGGEAKPVKPYCVNSGAFTDVLVELDVAHREEGVTTHRSRAFRINCVTTSCRVAVLNLDGLRSSSSLLMSDLRPDDGKLSRRAGTDTFTLGGGDERLNIDEGSGRVVYDWRANPGPLFVEHGEGSCGSGGWHQIGANGSASGLRH